jgi:predicted secreted hydrolase
MNRIIVIVVAALLAAGGVVAAWPRTPRTPIEATLEVRDALAEDRTGFARALAPRRFVFPADHGPHPDFRTEWWYYTGNLRTGAGRHLGFQLTFFRVALAPVAERRPSAWATRQLYFAHFAVTDTAAGRFHAASRLARGALDLAGAEVAPFRVWVDDWSAIGDGTSARLQASDGDVALDLNVWPAKPVVAQGDRGLSRKGPEPGNASYYYSFTRMPARGTVQLGAQTLEVSGEAWMDREWSTSTLPPGVEGWDWFALQLDDGRDLMFYLLRREDGTPDPLSAGTLVEADGKARPLAARDVRVEPTAHWTSPRTGVRYPARWRLDVPSAHLELDVEPRLANQELVVGTRYWEGAVSVSGRPVGGQGYVELVGYRAPGAAARLGGSRLARFDTSPIGASITHGRKEHLMDALVNMVSQRTGISEDKARTAVDTVIGFLKERAPAGLSGQLDSLLGGAGEGGGQGGVAGIASQVGGMFGKKDQS